MYGILTVAVMQCTAPGPHAPSGVICIPHMTSGIAMTGRTGIVMGMMTWPAPSGPGGPAAQHSTAQRSTAQVWVGPHGSGHNRTGKAHVKLEKKGSI
jgi:hypothetical protein